jgi:hypothetical protein
MNIRVRSAGQLADMHKSFAQGMGLVKGHQSEQAGGNIQENGDDQQVCCLWLSTLKCTR